ncbi:hypothetical protein HDV01_003137 [Terramyces sp. JEL0728]|nr:hypothetical protein HDV01_003137 [Terramyces sp. JEL0728]
MSLKSAVRTIKAIGKGYSDLELKVRQATCNDTWGPSGSLLQEICQYSYNERDFVVIMHVLDKRMNDSGKNWRHVFKALTVLKYLLENGSEMTIQHAKDNLHVIKTLKEYQYVDEEGRDQGANVRNIVKELILLLNDESMLRERRQGRGQLNERMGYQSGFRKSNEEDSDLRRAIEASKEQASIDENKRRELQEEADLQRAIELSEREALDRRRLQMNNTGDSYVSPKPKKDDIIDFFGSLEQPAPIQQQDPFGAFGGFDPFQQQQQLLQQQQQQMFMQQQMQQQYLLQQEQQQYLLQQEQQRLYNEQLQQQQMMQQNPFGNMQQQNTGINAPHNPFAAPAPPPVQKPVPSQKDMDLSSNPNAVLDPFAAIAKTQTNPVGPNTQQFQGNTGSANPFGAMSQNQTGQSQFGQMGGFGGFSQTNSSPTQFSQNPSPQQQNKQLFNLDASSLSSKTSSAAPKNPFSSTNTNHYQWEPQKPKPTLSELSGFTPMQPTSTGTSRMTPSLTGNSQGNPFQNQMQNMGQAPMGMNQMGQVPMGMQQQNPNPFQQQQQANPFGQSFF